MDAWEILTAGSTVPDGDAWEHLNAQGGGGGSSLVLIDGLECLVDQGEMEILVDQREKEILVDTAPLQVLVEQFNFTAELEL